MSSSRPPSYKDVPITVTVAPFPPVYSSTNTCCNTARGVAALVPNSNTDPPTTSNTNINITPNPVKSPERTHSCCTTLFTTLTTLFCFGMILLVCLAATGFFTDLANHHLWAGCKYGPYEVTYGVYENGSIYEGYDLYRDVEGEDGNGTAVTGFRCTYGKVLETAGWNGTEMEEARYVVDDTVYWNETETTDEIIEYAEETLEDIDEISNGMSVSAQVGGMTTTTQLDGLVVVSITMVETATEIETATAIESTTVNLTGGYRGLPTTFATSTRGIPTSETGKVALGL